MYVEHADMHRHVRHAQTCVIDAHKLFTHSGISYPVVMPLINFQAQRWGR